MPQSEYPRVGYMLALIGSLFQVLAAFMETFGFGFMIFFYSRYYLPNAYSQYEMHMMHVFPVVAISFVVLLMIVWAFALISLFSALLIRSNPEAGAVLTLVMALISFPTFWGFLIGSVLMLVGGILALTFKPSGSNPRTSQTGPSQAGQASGQP